MQGKPPSLPFTVRFAFPPPVTSSSSSPSHHAFHIPTDLVVQKCTRCPYSGPTHTFPPRRTGSGHLKVCTTCMEKQNTRKVASEMAAETSGRGQIATAAMSFDDFLGLVTLNKIGPFDFDTMVSVPPGFFVAGEHLYNRSNRIRDFLAEASEYHWKYAFFLAIFLARLLTPTCLAKRRRSAVENPPSSPTFVPNSKASNPSPAPKTRTANHGVASHATTVAVGSVSLSWTTTNTSCGYA
jgi:hypothetical protein